MSDIISLGKILQQKRQERKLEVKDVARFLSIKEALVVAIENDQIELLQDQKMYALGMVRSYAKFLKVENYIVDQHLGKIHLKSNTENKSHVLINIGEGDKLNPNKQDLFHFALIAILLFVISLIAYNFSASRNILSNEEIISKLQSE
jgi:cytoskeletal protein RodZ